MPGLGEMFFPALCVTALAALPGLSFANETAPFASAIANTWACNQWDLRHGHVCTRAVLPKVLKAPNSLKGPLKAPQRGEAGRSLSLKSVFSNSNGVMSNINELVLTESDVRPGELPSAETSCAHADSGRRRSRAYASPVRTRQGGSGQHQLCSRVGGGAVLCPLVGPSSLSSSSGWMCLPTGEVNHYTSPSVPSWIVTEHICSVGGRPWV